MHVHCYCFANLTFCLLAAVLVPIVVVDVDPIAGLCPIAHQLW